MVFIKNVVQQKDTFVCDCKESHFYSNNLSESDILRDIWIKVNGAVHFLLPSEKKKMLLTPFLHDINVCKQVFGKIKKVKIFLEMMGINLYHVPTTKKVKEHSSESSFPPLIMLV